jgi:hypothetical protein
MDTDPDVYALQLELLGRQSPDQRVANIAGLAEAVDMIDRARVRRRHPAVGDADLLMLIAVDRYGAEFVREISGWDVDALVEK